MSEISFENLGANDYERAKSVLNKAKHPGFVGRELFFRCATTGVACVAILDGADVGLAMIAKAKLQALSVITSAQGRGVGPALMTRLQPQWVSAIGERVGFFEKLGYQSVGAPKVGQNGKHSTQLMQRGDAPMTELPIGDAPRPPPTPQDEPENVPSLRILLDDSADARADAEIDMLDSLLQKAVVAEKFESALKIIEAAKVAAAQRARLKR